MMIGSFLFSAIDFCLGEKIFSFSFFCTSHLKISFSNKIVQRRFYIVYKASSHHILLTLKSNHYYHYFYSVNVHVCVKVHVVSTVYPSSSIICARDFTC